MSQPFSASSIATVDPPAPEPTTIALMAGPYTTLAAQFGDELSPVLTQAVDGVGHDDQVPLGRFDLEGGVSPRLGVPGVLDVFPANQIRVAAVLGVAVHRLDGVPEQNVREGRRLPVHQDEVLLGRLDRGKVAAGQLVEQCDATGVLVAKLR